MKITKAMGRACLDELECGRKNRSSDAALEQLGWNRRYGTSRNELCDFDHLRLAPCMAATIAGAI